MRGMFSRLIQTSLGLAFLTVLSMSSPASAQEEFTLGPDDAWTRETPEPGTPAARILKARQALALGEPERARALATAYLDRFPSAPGRAEMFLVRGDALVEMGDEYDALFDYEAIARLHPGSEVFVQALEREYDIAVAYANGLKRKFFGTIRIIDASDDAQELLIRIQERLPGSRLAEDAGMTLADFYFKRAEMRLASDAYDLFIQNYPRSNRIQKARQRLIQSYMASYRGPRHDASGLRDARRRLQTMQQLRPAAAQRLGAEALIVRIDESEARKLLVTARWYLSVSDPISAELYIRQVVERHPETVATLDALRLAPKILSQMPASLAAKTPDYRLLAEALLGKAGPVETGVSPRAEPSLPETKDLEPERPVKATPSEEPKAS